MKPRTRTLLGKLTGVLDRERVYLCEDAIEKDLVEGYDVETRRLFFSDMEMITWHRQFSKVGLWIGGLSLGLGVISLAMVAAIVRSDGGTSASVALWVTFWLAVAPNIPIMLWFLRPYAYVTVYGKRNRATMSWHFRHAESKRVFEEVSQVVRDFQEHARQQIPQTVVVPAALAPPGVPGVMTPDTAAVPRSADMAEAPQAPPAPAAPSVTHE